MVRGLSDVDKSPPAVGEATLVICWWKIEGLLAVPARIFKHTMHFHDIHVTLRCGYHTYIFFSY